MLPSLALALPFPCPDSSHAIQAYPAPYHDNVDLQAHVASEAKILCPSSPHVGCRGHRAAWAIHLLFPSPSPSLDEEAAEAANRWVRTWQKTD